MRAPQGGEESLWRAGRQKTALRQELAGGIRQAAIGKKAAYAEYQRSRDEMRELLLHKQNVDRMLGKDERSEEKKQEHDRQ